MRFIVATGNVKDQNDCVPFVANYLASTFRTPEWIRSNGMCLEQPTACESQLPHVRQDAFVQH